MGQPLRILISGALAGTLVNEGAGVSRFTYDASYRGPDISVLMPRLASISTSLLDKGPTQEGGVSTADTGGDCTRESPLEEQAPTSYVGHEVTNWFLGLLPDEDDTRLAMARNVSGVDASPFALLARYGSDCPGAVQALPAESSEAPAPAVDITTPIARATIAARLKAVSNAAESWEMPDEAWSLGGTQGKIALRLTDEGWESCLGRAATTHILKPGVAHLAMQALDEHISMLLAHAAGLPVARTWIESFDGTRAIVIERYDRAWDEGQVIRFHQEDLCQAFGVNPQCKYASDGGPTANAIMKMLARDTLHGSRDMFMRSLCLNYLIGATDGHAKNYSILHLRESEFVLAPLYDIASALPYFANNHVTYRTALGIGGENRIGWMRKGPLERFDRMNGLEPGTMRSVMLDTAWLLHDGMDDVFRHVEGEFSDEPSRVLVSRFKPRLRRLVEATIASIDTPGAAFSPAQVCGDE